MTYRSVCVPASGSGCPGLVRRRLGRSEGPGAGPDVERLLGQVQKRWMVTGSSLANDYLKLLGFS